MCSKEPSIVLGIPGDWKDRSEIVKSIALHSGGYLFAGKVLMHSKSKTHFGLEVYDHDPNLAEKVRLGSMGQIPEDVLDAIQAHTFTLYLLSYETGREVVERMVDAAVGLLESGGLAVKVEFAGFSVNAAQWREHALNKVAYSLYRSMVALVGDDTQHFTCGMRAFSLPDCSVQQSDLRTAFEVATEFCCYLMDESPAFADGHTFSVPGGTERYRVSFDEYGFYPPGDMFHNSNGLWKLETTSVP
jgi:hypothetical protein